MKFVAIGCGALIFLSCLCGGGVYWWTARQATALSEQYQQQLAQPSGGDTAAPAAGGTCAKAKACCEAIYSQPMFQGQGMQACAAVDQAAASGAFADAACSAQLEAFKQAGAGIPGGVPAACN